MLAPGDNAPGPARQIPESLPLYSVASLRGIVVGYRVRRSPQSIIEIENKSWINPCQVVNEWRSQEQFLENDDISPLS
jgi:hypothetical protein